MSDRLPFRMHAEVSFSSTPAPPDDAILPPGWVRIPVSFEVTLPAEVMERAKRGGGAGDPVAGPPHDDTTTTTGPTAISRPVARSNARPGARPVTRPPALDGVRLRPGLPF